LKSALYELKITFKYIHVIITHVMVKIILNSTNVAHENTENKILKQSNYIK